MIKILTMVLTVLALLASLFLLILPNPAPKPLVQVTPLVTVKTQSSPIAVNHTARSIELSRPKLSPVRKNVIAALINHIADTNIKTPENRPVWIALIGIESGYDGRARSNKGAVGLGQLLPKYRADFGASCGLGDVTADDLLDDATNLTLSSCYFQSLIDANNGNTSLAMVAYVAGPYSKDLAAAKQGKPTGKDAADYVKAIRTKQKNAEVPSE